MFNGNDFFHIAFNAVNYELLSLFNAIYFRKYFSIKEHFGANLIIKHMKTPPTLTHHSSHIPISEIYC